MKKNVLFLLFIGLFFLAPFQASADLTYVMTSFQSLGPLYASGEITGNLTGDLNISPLYSFCVDNTKDLYLNQTYNGATLTSIGNNQGLLESAYLLNKYVPSNVALTDVNQGVALQWAMWMALGQGSPLTTGGTLSLANTYGSVYSQALSYQTEAQNASNLSQYASQYKVLQLPGSQSLMLVQTSTGDIHPTPIPSSILLLSPGLMAIVAFRRIFQM